MVGWLLKMSATNLCWALAMGIPIAVYIGGTWELLTTDWVVAQAAGAIMVLVATVALLWVFGGEDFE